MGESMTFRLILAFLPDDHLDELLKAARGAGIAGQIDVEEAIGLMRQIKALEGRNQMRED